MPPWLCNKQFSALVVIWPGGHIFQFSALGPRIGKYAALLVTWPGPWIGKFSALPLLYTFWQYRPTHMVLSNSLDLLTIKQSWSQDTLLNLNRAWYVWTYLPSVWRQGFFGIACNSRSNSDCLYWCAFSSLCRDSWLSQIFTIWFSDMFKLQKPKNNLLQIRRFTTES